MKKRSFQKKNPMLFLKTSLIISLLLLVHLIQAQIGCTDPQATNFNAGAVQNDGSCLYPMTGYSAAYISNLGIGLREISGLNFSNGEWWAHNDSGFDPEFFSVNPSNGASIKKINLKDAQNRDWEDVCADGTNLYLGDFGNNSNNRQNLGIYKVPFSAIGNSSNQTVNASEYSFVPFAYPDQIDFTNVPEDSTVFDCEAMVFAQGKLHLFTKNRKEYQTTHYAIDLGNNSIQKIETFDSQGLITGASITPDGKTIALVGYDLRGLPAVFSWLLWDWQPGTDQFFSGNKRRIELGSAFTVGQVESIGFSTNRSGYFANERTEYGGILFVPQRIWGIDFNTWLPEIVATQDPSTSSQKLNIYPNPSSGILYFDVSSPEKVELQLINQLGERILIQGVPQHFDLSQYPEGIYTLLAIWEDGSTAARIVINQ